MKEVLTSIKVRNYRNFSEESPVELKIKKGITFIIGLNNIGKSNLLRMFYEFSDLFRGDEIRKTSKNPEYDLRGFSEKTLFSELCSQNSDRRFIEITILSEKKYKITVTPASENWEDSPRVRVTLQVDSEDVESIKKEEIPIAWELFGGSLYIGSHRSPFFNKGSNSLYKMANANQFISLWNTWSKGKSVVKRKAIQQLIFDLKEIIGFSEFNISTDNETLIIKSLFGRIKWKKGSQYVT